MTIYDQPERPLALEVFTNVEDPRQAEDFANLSEQDELHLLFYDERLTHRLTKGVRLAEPSIIVDIMMLANGLAATIPKACFSFEKAKESVMKKAKL